MTLYSPKPRVRGVTTGKSMSDIETASASQEDRTLAMLTHLSGIILSFIVPLVIWLTNKDKADKGWLNDQAKEALRAWDQLANAGLFGGLARESLSSHAWRARGAWWASAVVRVTDLMQPGHCEASAAREAPVVAIVERKP